MPTSYYESPRSLLLGIVLLLLLVAIILAFLRMQDELLLRRLLALLFITSGILQGFCRARDGYGSGRLALDRLTVALLIAKGVLIPPLTGIPLLLLLGFGFPLASYEITRLWSRRSERTRVAT